MPKNVTVYALSTCIHCKNAKRFLDEHKYPYECVYVDTLEGDERKDTIEKVKSHNPRASFPTIVIDDGEIVIVGFQREDIKEALGLE